MTNLNWVDVLIIIIIIRCLYVGANRGLVIEFFKFLGMIFAVFITQHFYVRCAAVLPFIPESFGEPLAFILLWFFVILVFHLIRNGWMLICKNEESPFLGKLMGACLSVIRGVLIGGMIALLLFVSGNRFLVKSARQAFVYPDVVSVPVRFYSVTFEAVVHRLFPEEKKNDAVFELFGSKTKGRRSAGNTGGAQHAK